MKEFKDLLFEVSLSWEKKRGLIIALILSNCIYFFFLKPIILEGNLVANYWLLNLITPIGFSLIISTIWLFSTNRIALPKFKRFKLGVFIFVDEESSEKRIKQIVKHTIDEIKLDFNKEIKIVLFPINYINSRQDLVKYIRRYPYSIDCAIFAKVISGNVKESDGNVTEEIEIKSMTFSGKFNVHDKYQIFKTTISLSEELFIRSINKNWSYIENNSKRDKQKIIGNLRDSILYYCGIYHIYLRNPEKSLDILKTLQSSLDSKAKIDLKKKEIIGNKRFVSAARLNEILLNLFVLNSARAYAKDDIDTAYNSLKECEKMFGNHPQSLIHNTALARHSYELGKIEEAKEYTAKVKQLSPKSPAVLLNYGFFGIIEDNEDEVYKNYKLLTRYFYKFKKSRVNFIDVISWLEKQKDKYPKQNILFEFAIGTLNLYYSDKDLGVKILQNIDTNLFEKKYPKLNNLRLFFLQKKISKPISAITNKVRKKKKKKKKRKNRE